MTTYPEEFPPGTRVVVSAGEREGTDNYYTGKHGSIKSWPTCSIAWIQFDGALRSGLRNPYLITCHNIRREKARKR